MNGHIIEQLAPGAKIGKKIEQTTESGNFQKTIQSNIAALHVQSRTGLWGIVAFMLLSAGALVIRDISVFERLPDAVLAILGDPLPPLLIHAVLAASTLSSFIIIMGRIAEGGKPGKGWQLVGFRAFFYFLYIAAAALDQFIVLIFVSGLFILALDHYQRWTWCRAEIRREKEQLRKLALWPLAAMPGK